MHDLAGHGNGVRRTPRRAFTPFREIGERWSSNQEQRQASRPPRERVQLRELARTRPDALVAFGLGVAIALGALLFFALHPQKPELLALLAAEIAGGREVGIPTGIALGLGWQSAAVATTFIELTSLFLLFPLLVALAAGLHQVRWLESSLTKAQDYARRNPDVDVLALGALTFAPFVPVGALTSVLIGELLRLPSRYLLPVLAAALVLANIVTGFATAKVLSFFPNPQLVAAMMTALLLLVAAGAWLVHRLRRRAAAREAT